MFRLYIIFFLVSNLEAFTRPAPMHLIHSAESGYVLVQAHTDKRVVRINKKADKKLGYIYTISTFDYQNKTQEYKRSSHFTFNSMSKYTKAWLTDNVILLTNNYSDNKEPCIAVIDTQSVIQEYMLDFNTKDLFKYRMALSKYSIDAYSMNVLISTTAGSYSVPAKIWHCYVVKIFESGVSITLGATGTSDANWNYDYELKKGGFWHKNEEIPTKIRILTKYLVEP